MKNVFSPARIAAALLCALSAAVAPAADNGSYTWKQDLALNCSTCQTTLRDVIMDTSGNAITVWAEDNNGARSIQAARFDAATQTWGTPQLIASVAPTSLQLGVDRYGNVKAAYLVGGAFYMAQFHASTRTWTAPRLVFRGNVLPGGRRSFAVDPEGNAYFTYLRVTGATTADGSPVHSVAVFRYTASTDSWKGMTVDATAEQAFSPSIGTDSAGNAIVVWGVRVSGAAGESRGNIKVSRFRPVNGYWGHVRVLASHGGAFDPQVALRSNGRAVATWGVFLNGVHDVHVRQYDPVKSLWGNRFEFGVRSAVPAYGLNVAVDSLGNAFVAWADSQRGQMLRRFAVSTATWSSLRVVDDGTDFSMPDLAVDSSGNAVHAFSTNATSGTTSAVRYDATTGTWGLPTAINQAGELGDTAQVAMSPDGSAIAAWRQPSGQTINGTAVQHLSVNRLAP